jgi:hypothetical protein
MLEESTFFLCSFGITDILSRLDPARAYLVMVYESVFEVLFTWFGFIGLPLLDSVM